MVYDLDMLKAFYASFEKKIGRVRAVLQRPLTLAEKILYTHLYDDAQLKNYERGEDYVNFRPDRVDMQDATAQIDVYKRQSILFFMFCVSLASLLRPSSIFSIFIDLTPFSSWFIRVGGKGSSF